MSRLQTKCVFASAMAHGLLLAVLVVSSAFVKPPPKEDNARFIKLFDASKITDDETSGGGNPNVPSDATPAPVPIIPAPAPVVTPIVQEKPPVRLPEPEPPAKVVEKPKVTEKPKPEPEKPKVKPKTVDTTPKVVKKPDAKRIVPDKKLTEKQPEVAKPEKPKIEVNLDVKKATPDPDAQKKRLERERAAKEAREREEADRRAAIRAQMEATERANREYRQRQAALGAIVGNIQNKMSAGTVVEMPGPGGEAFINYADLIWTRYYQAWQTPDSRDVRNPVKVEIVVAKDGRVLSANIIRSSGDAQLDKSVRQALDRVSKLPPFPEGAKDPQRTFKINFELKSKRQFG